jgi:hypothetical protein
MVNPTPGTCDLRQLLAVPAILIRRLPNHVWAHRLVTGKIVSAASQMGFKFLFDANYAANMTINNNNIYLVRSPRCGWLHRGLRLRVAFMPVVPLGSFTPCSVTPSLIPNMRIWDEGTELIVRVTSNDKLPIFTSICPARINFVREIHPQLIPNLSTPKSPHMMPGLAVMK